MAKYKQQKIKKVLKKILILIIIFFIVIWLYDMYSKINVSQYEENNKNMVIEKTSQKVEKIKEDDKTIENVLEEITRKCSWNF